MQTPMSIEYYYSYSYIVFDNTGDSESIQVTHTSQKNLSINSPLGIIIKDIESNLWIFSTQVNRSILIVSKQTSHADCICLILLHTY